MEREPRIHEHEQRFTRKIEHVDHLYIYIWRTVTNVTRYIYPGREEHEEDRTIEEIDVDPNPYTSYCLQLQ